MEHADLTAFADLADRRCRIDVIKNGLYLAFGEMIKT